MIRITTYLKLYCDVCLWQVIAYLEIQHVLLISKMIGIIIGSLCEQSSLLFAIRVFLFCKLHFSSIIRERQLF